MFSYICVVASGALDWIAPFGASSAITERSGKPAIIATSRNRSNR